MQRRKRNTTLHEKEKRKRKYQKNKRSEEKEHMIEREWKETGPVANSHLCSLFGLQLDETSSTIVTLLTCKVLCHFIIPKPMSLVFHLTLRNSLT